MHNKELLPPKTNIRNMQILKIYANNPKVLMNKGGGISKLNSGEIVVQNVGGKHQPGLLNQDSETLYPNLHFLLQAKEAEQSSAFISHLRTSSETTDHTRPEFLGSSGTLQLQSDKIKVIETEPYN